MYWERDVRFVEYVVIYVIVIDRLCLKRTMLDEERPAIASSAVQELPPEAFEGADAYPTAVAEEEDNRPLEERLVDKVSLFCAFSTFSVVLFVTNIPMNM